MARFRREHNNWSSQPTGYLPKRRGESSSRLGAELFNWRQTLHSVFVANIDWRLSSMDIWHIFNAYGVVMDVFLPRNNRHRRVKYAFVRYWYREELRRAILMGNNQIVGGRSLKVYTVVDRKLDRREERWVPSTNQHILENRKEIIETQQRQEEGEQFTHTQNNGTREDFQHSISVPRTANHMVADGLMIVEHKGQASQCRLPVEAVENNIKEDIETNNSEESSEYFSKAQVQLDL